MAKMKVVQVPKAGADFELVEREIPQPPPGHVRVRVLASGICHSDVLTKDGGYPGLTFPRSPGHEIAGVIDEVGTGVTTWTKGQRVGVGWHGGQDGTCLACRRGDFVNCDNALVTGINFDGGYAEYMIAPSAAVAHMPESLDPAEAAPLLCAGVTTFNSLRNSGAVAGDLVAVQGIGGLGHLGIQFAQKLGYRVAAIGRGADNGALARKLGAHVYIDSAATNAAAELQKLGGARAILSTAPSGKAMSALIDGLGANGVLLVVGAGAGCDRGVADPAHPRQEAHPGLVLGRRHRLRGHAALRGDLGRAADDREDAAGEGGGGLREDDERPGAFPRRAHDVVAPGWERWTRAGPRPVARAASAIPSRPRDDRAVTVRLMVDLLTSAGAAPTTSAGARLVSAFSLGRGDAGVGRG